MADRAPVPIACTSIARHRVAHARAIASLVAAHHPGARLQVLVADDPHGEVGEDEPFDVLRPGDVGVASRDVHLLACCTTVDELAAVLAPRLAARLLGAGAEAVAVLGPEVVVVNPLDELDALARAHGVVLVPRLLAAVPHDGRYPDEVTVGDRGAIDPGIVAVAGERGSAFCDWWAAALARAATRPRAVPLDLGQPMLDLLAGDPNVHLLRDPAYGVAFWNAHEREIGRTPEGMYTAEGRPLRLVNLVGFEPGRPYLMRDEPSPNERVRLSERPLLAQVCLDQAARLVLAGYPPPQAEPAFARCADGTPFDARMRRLVQAGVAASERRSATAHPVAPPPDPFDPETVGAFFDWLMTGDESAAQGRLVPRYLLEVYNERRDLQWHFPRLSTVDTLGFRHWVGYHGITEEVPGALRPHLEASAWWAAPSGVFVAPESQLKDGVTLTGYLRAELGVGEAARLVLDALQGTRAEVSTIPVDVPTSRQAHPFHQAGVPIADRRINLIWLNAEYLLGFAALVSPAFFAGRYNVGGWVWETEHLPAEMAANAAMLDEIWVPSEFVRGAVEPLVDVPVHLFPYPVVTPAVDRRFSPSSIGVPEQGAGAFYFLFSFDFLSAIERKNPLGVLDAFTAAFAPGEGPTLVLKSVNGDQRPVDHERLLAAASKRPDVVVMDGYLSAGERGALLAACGCYVSLHRAEGFGLGMAEAMALGRPVIATAYSGNLQFMDDTTAFLIPAGRVRVGEHAAPYDPDEEWADPDLGAAAAAMRSVYEDPPGARARAERARLRVLAEHGRPRAVRFLDERIEAIQHLDDAGYVTRGPEGLAKLLG